MTTIKKNAQGILLCMAAGIPAWFLGVQLPVVGGPIFAILIGIIIGHLLKNRGSLDPGIKFTSKKILQYAVILLGFGMNFGDILTQGKQSLPIIISTITTSLVISFVLYKTMKMPKDVSILVGVGSSICGGSAIAATAPVIEANEEDIAQSISVIFFFNVIAALIFPTLGGILGMSNEGFGLFAGTAINDTSSVTAAATAWDGIHGSMTIETATIVKLTRTLAIIPITVVLALYNGKKNQKEGSTFSLMKVFPHFILFFLLAAVITTVFSINPAVIVATKNLSKFFIIMAMVAIGINTDIVKLVKTGGKPLLMGLCCWIGIAGVSIGIQHMLGIW